MGAKIISKSRASLVGPRLIASSHLCHLVFSLVSCVAAVHGIRAAMRSLKKTGTDFSSAQGMDPKAFFEVMGKFMVNDPRTLPEYLY